MRRVANAVAPAITLALVLSAAALMPASAKLPPLSDEAKAKAAETAAKTAWTGKVGDYQLCRAMERTAEHYRSGTKTAGKVAPAAVDTPACSDPGAFVPPVAAAPAAPAASAPPLEAAGAHSPPKTAIAPPSGKATAAEIQGQAKK